VIQLFFRASGASENPLFLISPVFSPFPQTSYPLECIIPTIMRSAPRLVYPIMMDTPLLVTSVKYFPLSPPPPPLCDLRISQTPECLNNVGSFFLIILCCAGSVVVHYSYRHRPLCPFMSDPPVQKRVQKNGFPRGCFCLLLHW